MGAKPTLDQRAKVDAVALQMREEAHCTSPIDREQCKKAVHAAYKYLELAVPSILFVESPVEAFKILKERTGEIVPDASPAARSILGSIGLPEDILEMMMSAQPRNTEALGEEVDLTLNHEQNRAMDRGRKTVSWEPLSVRIWKHLAFLNHFAHAVDNTLAEQVAGANHRWLVYSGGAASIWEAAEPLVRVRAMYELGALDSIPKALEVTSAVVKACGWVNAFEKLCIISERPAELRQIRESGRSGKVTTFVRWRDGEECELVYQ